jgi:hypothetical protein
MYRSASTAVAASGALCLALLLGACGQPATPGAGSTTTATNTTTASPTESVSPTSTTKPATTSAPATKAPTTAGWTKYTTTDGEFTFEYPSAWTIKDPAGELAEGGGVFLTVSNENGKQMATLRSNMSVGSTCTERYSYGVLDIEPLPALAQGGETPKFIFESRTDPTATDPAKMNPMAYGIMSGPEPSGPDACPIFHFFTWPPNAAMFSGVYDPFDTTGGGAPNPGVDNPHAYMETQEYQDVKRMITSLKPAS